MLIKQIIKFELRGPGPPGRRPICTPTTSCFCEKTNIFKENFKVDYYLQLEYSTRQCTLLSPT